jgi:hypothetical protein
MTHVWYVVLADIVLVVHSVFVLFVLFGALFVIRWPWMMWVHLPALLWGVFVETSGTECPLTPLENRLRFMAGESGYGGDFVFHWVMPVIYPEALTRQLQLMLAGFLTLVNVAVYAWIWKRQSIERARRSVSCGTEWR